MKISYAASSGLSLLLLSGGALADDKGIVWEDTPPRTAERPIESRTEEREAPEPRTEEPIVDEPTSEALPSRARKKRPERTSSEEGADGVRFRFGASGGGGILSGGPFSFTYGGVDLRFGAQINDLFGIYAQPQIGIYTASSETGGPIGAGGLIGGSVVADFTPVDYFFVGVGAGYAVLNNPGGTELHARLGFYPLVSRSDSGVRRHGLMFGADLRLHFVADLTFVSPTFSVGYEAF